MPNAFNGLGASAPYVPDYLQDEIQFRIDNDLRTIAIPADGVVLGVVGDKNVNHVNFQMPAWYNGFNMSLFQARINFIDASGNANYYTVTDMTVMTPEGTEVTGVPSENDIIYFTWLVDSYATGYVGSVRFNVRLTKFDTSVNPAVLSQAFNTQVNSCQVLEGIQLADEVTQEQAEDILFHMSSELQDITDSLKHDLEVKRDEMLDSIPDDYTAMGADVSVLNHEAGKTQVFTITETSPSLTYLTKTCYIQKGKRYLVDISLIDENMSALPSTANGLAFILRDISDAEHTQFNFASSGLYSFVASVSAPKITYGMVAGNYTVTIYEYSGNGLTRVGGEYYNNPHTYHKYNITVNAGDTIVVDVSDISSNGVPLSVFVENASGDAIRLADLWENGRYRLIAPASGTKLSIGGSDLVCACTLYKAAYTDITFKQSMYTIDGMLSASMSDVYNRNAYLLGNSVSGITVFSEDVSGATYKTAQYPIQKGRAYLITAMPNDGATFNSSNIAVFVMDYDDDEKRIFTIPLTGLNGIWIADDNYKQISIGYSISPGTAHLEFKELSPSINGKMISHTLSTASYVGYATITVNLSKNHRYTMMYDFDESNMDMVVGSGTLGLFGKDAANNETKLLEYSASGAASFVAPADLVSLSLGYTVGAWRARLIDEGILEMADTSSTSSAPTSNVVTVGSSGCTFTKVVDAIRYSQQHANTVIKLTPGTYDITSETNIANEQGGLPLGNGVHIIGCLGANIICNYTGGNAGVQEAFSIFNAQPSDFTLENVHLHAYNVRYCVHDECSYTTSPYTHKYIDCQMYHDSHEAQWHTPQCIGGGHGTNGTIIIEGGVYECYPTSGMGPNDTTVNCPLSWHYNTGNKDAYNIFIVRDVYLKGAGAFMYFGGGAATSASHTSVYISGCNFGESPINYSDADAPGATSTASLTAWNNYIRNDGE